MFIMMEMKKKYLFHLFDIMTKDADVFEDLNELTFLFSDTKEVFMCYHHHCLYYDDKFFNKCFRYFGMLVEDDYVTEWFNTRFPNLKVTFTHGADRNKQRDPLGTSARGICIYTIGKKVTSLYLEHWKKTHILK